jgi:lipopolysaccharide heptosyltransferase II
MRTILGHKHSGRNNYDTDALALASLVKYGPVRLWLSRLFEVLLLPFVRLGNLRNESRGSEPKSILVVEYWNLGDFVMLTPFLKNLRLHYPKAHIAIVASPRIIPLLEGQGLVDEIVPVNMPWARPLSRRKKYFSRYWGEYVRCIARLRASRFDLGFTVRADIRDNFLLWITRVKRRVGYGYGYGGSLLTDVVKPDLTRPHYLERWLTLLEHLGKPVLDRRPQLKMSAEDKERARKFLRALGVQEGDAVVGVHSGARNPIRNWGDERFLEVARRLVENFPVKVLWFHDEGHSCANGNSGILPVAVPLREFLAVLAECRVLICNDTGPMHMAGAYGVPAVAVFGPGMEAWWGPRSSGSKVVSHEGVWCRPCFDYCIFDEPYCLRVVTVDSVYEAAAGALRTILGAVQPSKVAIGASPEPLEIISSAEHAAD